MFEVNFLLIKPLIELLKKKISLNKIIPAGSLMLVRHSDISLSSRYPKDQDKETRRTSMTCSSYQCALIIILISGKIVKIKIPTTIAFLSRK